MIRHIIHQKTNFLIHKRRKKQETIEEGTVKSSLSARLSVKLPFGTGYFNPADLTLIENSSSFGDKKLCTRWMAMLETAKKMGTVADSKSVDNHNAIQLPIAQSKGDKNDDADDDDLTESSILPDAANTEMDIDDLSTVPNAATLTKNNKMVSFNAGILPLGNNTVPNIDLPQMENAVQKLLKGSGGVVGARNYPSVPSGYRKWESNREELRILEGEAIQLRNKVYRQKRIRFLNERSCNSNKDRSDRFESLLTEMKADLSILKKRLNDELIELGIDQSKAEELLAENYSQESKDDDYKVASHGEKRKRKG